MARITCGLLAALLLVVSYDARAADSMSPVGVWKVTLLGPGQQLSFWLLKLENKEGKWTGEVLSLTERIPKASVSDVSVKDGQVRFLLKVDPNQKFIFEGKLPPEGSKKVLGSLYLDRLHPAQLELTGLKKLDLFELNKEIVAQQTGPEMFDAALALLKQAESKKAKIDEVRSWANKLNKAAEAHGTQWQLDTALKIAEALTGQEEFVPVALQYARQAERLVTPGDKPAVQKRVLTVLAAALKKSGKEEEAKELEARIDKLPAVGVTKYAGRKGKSNRAVLVELFTGAECPPCVAADLGFDALAKTYKPKEVILLQYHLHVPGPDPLTNADTEARQKYYDDEVDSTPTILFDGKTVEGVAGGGRIDRAQDKYEEYVSVIDPLLEKDAKAAIDLKAEAKGDKIEISADVSDLDKTGEKVRLRFVLVEETVKYQGGNRLEAHHHVVREMPGGAEGFALKDKSAKKSVSVDLKALRKKLSDYLDESGKKRKFPNKERPMDLTKLRVVAFVQNDATKEVLQAAEVPIEVKAEK